MPVLSTVYDAVELRNMQVDIDGVVDPVVKHIPGSDYFMPGFVPPNEKVTQIDTKDEGTPDSWIPRHPALVRLTGRHPFNCEPPIAQEYDHGFISPVSLHYVRNHGAAPNLDWNTHTLKVSGLVDKEMELSMADLTSGMFQEVTIPVTLVCAGNRRKEENVIKQGLGFSWGPGAVSNCLWTGVWLKDVLQHAGIKSYAEGARFVCIGGVDKLPGGIYGTSLRREVALGSECDVLVAYKMNGKLLTPDHGYPVRMIIPGYIGGRMVKWLDSIKVTSEESDSHYHFFDNRVLPPQIDAERALSEGWWYKPEYIINELNINSAIVYPRHDEIVPLASAPTYTLKGYCYGGGGMKITRMEVSFDDGATWELAELQLLEKPRPMGKYWCWTFWQYEVDMLRLMNCKDVLCRGWQGQNTQPHKITWNLLGMMNNCCFRVKVHPYRADNGEVALRFEHPTQPGPLPGGWMLREKGEKPAEVVAVQAAKAPTANGTANGVAKASTTTKKYTMEQVAKHNEDDDCWIVVENKVYDVTKFLNDHPGGSDSITMSAGEDATEDFNALHGDKARAMLAEYLIGEVRVAAKDNKKDKHQHTNGVSQAPDLVTLNSKKKIALKLLEREELTHNTRRFRFELPTPEHRLGLPIGKHFFVSGKWNDETVIRAYTPTTGDEVKGYVDLVIKVYFPNERFPLGGKMGQLLDSLKIGETVDVKGPLGEIVYHGKSQWELHKKMRTATKVAMMAGGSGITPMYQVVKASLADPEDKTIFSLVYANVSEDDILLRKELDALQLAHPKRFHVWYTVDKVVDPANWKYSQGFMSEQMFREHLPAGGGGDSSNGSNGTTNGVLNGDSGGDLPAVAFMCGPPPMIKFACLPNLEKIGYKPHQCFTF